MGKVLVIYHSDQGHTRSLAELVAEGARSVEGTDVELVPAAELDVSAAAEADGYAIGSPNYFEYVAGEVKSFFDKILNDRRFHGKPYVGFGTHGEDEKVLGVLERLASQCHLREVMTGLECRYDHVMKCAQAGHALGRALAEAVAHPKHVKHPSPATAPKS